MAFSVYDDENDEWLGDQNCPICRREYDEIDYEYQICHWCRFDNSGEKIQQTDSDTP